jgi:hypothetical protein
MMRPPFKLWKKGLSEALSWPKGMLLSGEHPLHDYVLTGGLPAHIRKTLFVFGPTNFDEVYVQATYIEAGKAGVSGESSSRKEDKRNWTNKKEKEVTRKEKKPSCKNCNKEGHDEDHCW